MKGVFMAGLILAAAITAKAQTGMYANKWENNEKAHHTRTVTKEANQFEGTTMDASASYISFSNLPDMNKSYCAMITDGEGEFIKQRKITPEDNQLSVNRLGKGLYFVTIVCKNKGQKTFVLNR